MPSFPYNNNSHHEDSREKWGHDEYYGHDNKMSRPYEHRLDHYEPDVRPQYPRVVPRTHSSQRPRRSWPPSPRAEDERVSLAREYKPQWSDTSSEAASFPGAVDQQPIIEDVNPHPYTAEETDSDSDSYQTGSSNDSYGPRTPPDPTGRNQDQRYVYIPQEGIEIPLTYDEPREPRYAAGKPVQIKPELSRGRNERPRLDTDLKDKNSNPLPPRERAPSPYAYAPKPKTREAVAFGDHLLSPDAVSPQMGLPPAPGRTQSQKPHPRESSRRPHQPDGKVGDDHERPQRASRSAKPPPPNDISSKARSGVPASALGSGPRSSYYNGSSDESDGNRRRGSKLRAFSTNGPPPPDSGRKQSVPPASPPPRAKSAIPPPLSPLPAGLVAANDLQASPPFSSRRASPRASPVGSPVQSATHSPFASPPATPPSERDPHRNSTTRMRESGARSRAPLQALPPPSPRSSGFSQMTESDYDRPSRRHAPRSRRTTPLPSPTPSRPQIDVRAPSPANHQKSFSHGTDESMYRNSRPLSLAPFDIPPPSTLRPPEQGQRRRASSSADVRPQFSTNSTGVAPLAPFETSPRSPSKTPRPGMPGRAVSMGAVPVTLPPCPRSSPVAGYDDWYTLTGGPSSFSICPPCRNAFLNAGHERHLKPKSRHIAEQHLRCDMSLPWVRSAYNSILKKGRSGMNTVLTLADILADELPCPGKVEDRRDWYRLKDPDNDRSVHDFQICPSCVQQLETVLPPLRGMFHRSRSHHSSPRVCSLRADSKRFSSYVELLEDIAKEADERRRPPHMHRFLELAKGFAELQECTRDDMLQGQEWYFIPDLLEFTVCEDCFEEVVWPAIKRDMPVASDFKRHAKAVAPSHVGVSCQLYSPRMRRIFHDACHRNDKQLLHNAALQRYNVEQDLQARNLDVQRWPREERAREMARLLEEWKRWE